MRAALPNGLAIDRLPTLEFVDKRRHVIATRRQRWRVQIMQAALVPVGRVQNLDVPGSSPRATRPAMT